MSRCTAAVVPVLASLLWGCSEAPDIDTRSARETVAEAKSPPEALPVDPLPVKLRDDLVAFQAPRREKEREKEHEREREDMREREKEKRGEKGGERMGRLPAGWFSDYAKALAKAKATGQPLLVVFH